MLDFYVSTFHGLHMWSYSQKKLVLLPRKKTIMTIKKQQAFEDVFPIKNCDFLANGSFQEVRSIFQKKSIT